MFPSVLLSPMSLCRNRGKTNFFEKGRGGWVEKIQSGNLWRFEIQHVKCMNTLNLMQATIFHNLKIPHSKSLEPDCVSPSVSDRDTISGARGDNTHV